MDAMRARIAALDFDHDLFCIYPGAPFVSKDDILCTDARVHAAIQRLDALETPFVDKETQEAQLVTTMQACKKKMSQRNAQRSQGLLNRIAEHLGITVDELTRQLHEKISG